MVDYWTGVRYVLNFEATKTVSTQQTIRVHVSQKSKTCRTHVQQFFIEHLPTTTFQCEERNFGYKVLLVSNSDAAAWHSFKATLIFICQCCSWAPPPLLPHLKLPGSDRIFVLGSYMICLIVASSSYTFFFVYYCSACASHGLEQIRLSWA